MKQMVETMRLGRGVSRVLDRAGAYQHFLTVGPVPIEPERCRRSLKENATGSIREEITRKWFGNGRVMSMYTTRRILLGKYAEQVIGC